MLSLSIDAALAAWRAVERRIRLLWEKCGPDKIPGATDKVPEAKRRSNMKAQISLLEELDLVRGSILSTMREPFRFTDDDLDGAIFVGASSGVDATGLVVRWSSARMSMHGAG